MMFIALGPITVVIIPGGDGQTPLFVQISNYLGLIGQYQHRPVCLDYYIQNLIGCSVVVVSKDKPHIWNYIYKAFKLSRYKDWCWGKDGCTVAQGYMQYQKGLSLPSFH